MVLCVNLSGLMLQEYGINYENIVSENSTELRDTYNYTSAMEGGKVYEQEFYNVGRWGYKTYQVTRQLIFGFHDDVVSLGVPSGTALIFDTLWIFIMGNWFYCLLSGRDYMP